MFVLVLAFVLVLILLLSSVTLAVDAVTLVVVGFITVMVLVSLASV